MRLTSARLTRNRTTSSCSVCSAHSLPLRHPIGRGLDQLWRSRLPAIALQLDADSGRHRRRSRAVHRRGHDRFRRADRSRARLRVPDAGLPARADLDASGRGDLNAAGVDLTRSAGCGRITLRKQVRGCRAPGLETTWVWDASTHQWHERARWIDGAWESMDFEAVFFSGAHYSARGTKLFTLDQSANTIEGVPMVRDTHWPHLISLSMDRQCSVATELLCTTGYGGNVTPDQQRRRVRLWAAVASLAWCDRPLRSTRALARPRRGERSRFRVRCSWRSPFSIYAATLDATHGDDPLPRADVAMADLTNGSPSAADWYRWARDITERPDCDRCRHERHGQSRLRDAGIGETKGDNLCRCRCCRPVPAAPDLLSLLLADNQRLNGEVEELRGVVNELWKFVQDATNVVLS